MEVSISSDGNGRDLWQTTQNVTMFIIFYSPTPLWNSFPSPYQPASMTENFLFPAIYLKVGDWGRKHVVSNTLTYTMRLENV